MAATLQYEGVGMGQIIITSDPKESIVEVLGAFIRAYSETAKSLSNVKERRGDGKTQTDFSGYVHLDDHLGNVVHIHDMDGLLLQLYVHREGPDIYSLNSELLQFPGRKPVNIPELMDKANGYLSESSSGDPLDYDTRE